jgi:hypothetical protein
MGLLKPHFFYNILPFPSEDNFQKKSKFKSIKPKIL